MHKHQEKILLAAVCLLWVSAIFDPTGHTLHLRNAALFSIAVLAVYYKLYKNKIRLIASLNNSAFICLAIVMPVYGLVIYLARGCCDFNFNDKSYILSSVLIIASALIYANKRICLKSLNIFIFILRVLAAIEIFTLLISVLPFYGHQFHLLMINNIGYIDYRNYSGINYPYIYYLASPLLIYLCAHDLMCLLKKLNNENLFFYCFSIAALFASGTRAHMIIAVLFPILYLTIKYMNIRIMIIILMFMASLYFLKNPPDINHINTIFSKNEYSNSIKIGYLQGYGEIFSNPLNLIFGQGFNARSWSDDLNQMLANNVNASKTELTYLEIVRVYGLIIGSIIIFSLVKIAAKLRNIPKRYQLDYLYPGFVIYLLNCALNPYLFSSNGMLPIGLFLALIISLDGSKHSGAKRS